MEKPLVSVIVPIYNTEKYLCDCINSIISQTYSNLEIILIDDGSCDNCPKICDDYLQEDKRIKVIHQRNCGLSSARNSGINIARGEYICFVDSDDRLKLNAIEVMVRAAQVNDVNLVICGLVFNNGVKSLNHTFGYDRKFNNRELVESYLSNSYINHMVQNKLYSRGFFDDLKFDDVSRHEDMLFTIKLLSKVDEAFYIKDCLYIQNQRIGSMERSKFKENDLIVLDIVRYRQSFVREKYSDLYKYIKFEYIEYVIHLLKRILSEFVYKKNQSIYNKLLGLLSDEIKSVGSLEQNENLSKTSEFILEHPVCFRIKGYYNGAILRAIKIIRGMQICLKAKQKRP